jgi:enamine deaminase RidA (YjgF/YER057c/UK114 family)
MNGERVLERGKMVYAQAAAPGHAGDIETQTRRVLERIDELLAAAGSDKSKLLTAKIRLADMSLLDAHAAVWNEWLASEKAPLRLYTQGALARPEMLVEVMVTALK